MLLELTKRDEKKIIINLFSVTLEETDFGLVVRLPDGDKVTVVEKLNDVKYFIAQAQAAMAQANSGKIVT